MSCSRTTILGNLFRKLLASSTYKSPTAGLAFLKIRPNQPNLKFSVKMRPQFEVLPTPVKSHSDKKIYKVIKLQNGLTACLISDQDGSLLTDQSSEEESDFSTSDDSSSLESFTDIPSEPEEPEDTPKKNLPAETKMAAAALCIGVGSFSDPKEVPGMAHFLEHMVFMGSEKFPAENDFDAFIKKGGGSDNASTDAEVTTFYFECLEKNLRKALDKFAQFFISPLMKKNAITREREAIESEFQMALPSDSSRREQLLCSLAQKKSPVNSFAWGNLITLKENIDEDTLYNGVHNFRKRHYSAHRMTLAIQARLPMEELEEYVVESFAAIPTNNLPPDDFSRFAKDIYNTPEFKRMYYIKPTKDLCQVDLTWALPSLLGKYKSKPHQYVSYLLGDEGKGSLLSYLRKKVWVLGTTIGNGETGTEHNSMFCLFSVIMVLTEEGLKHIDEVIEAVFSYLNMLRRIGAQKRIFEEIQLIAETSFRFSTESSAVDVVEDLSESMQFYPPEDYITGSELYFEYNPQEIEKVLDLLQPDNMNIIVYTKKLPENLMFDKKEKWFGTEYCDLKIPQEWIDRWIGVEPYAEMEIPQPNPYITTDFSILSGGDDSPEYPTKILSSPVLELWFKKDQKFKLPIAYYYFYLISPKTFESPTSLCMIEMLVNLMVVDVTEEGYPATTADLSYSFSPNDRGIQVRVSGYNQKLPILVDLIAKYLKNLSGHINKEMFEAVKDKLVKNYYNKLLRPSTLAKNVRLNILVSNHWTSADKYKAMKSIQFEAAKTFISDFLKTLRIKSLVQGNVDQETAKTTVNKFVETIACQPLKDEDYPIFKVVELPKGKACCRIQNFNKNDSNSIIINYYQCGPYNLRGNCILETIMLIIEEPLFDILRTKEQLGYNVSCSLRDTFGVLGFVMLVNAQATKNTTEHVDKRIEAFILHADKLLQETLPEELDQIKNDLIKMKRVADVHLKEEMDRNWTEIISDDYTFDRLKKEIEVIENLKVEDLRAFWRQYNGILGNQNYRKLSIQIVGHNIKKKTAGSLSDSSTNVSLVYLSDSKDENFIKDINEFKKNLKTFPVTKKV